MLTLAAVTRSANTRAHVSVLHAQLCARVWPKPPPVCLQYAPWTGRAGGVSRALDRELVNVAILNGA